MSCDVAALPFEAHANYGTWSIDFEYALVILYLPQALNLIINIKIILIQYSPHINLIKSTL